MSSMDCSVNCTRCGGESHGSGSSTAQTTTTDLTNPEVLLEECYEKVLRNFAIEFLKYWCIIDYK